MGLSSSLLTDVPDPLLGRKNLLGNLHKNSEGIPYIYIYIRRSLAFNSKMCWLTYRGKVHLQGQEEVGLSHAPKSLYIFGEEKRSL